MTKTSAKTKIVLVTVGWLVASAIMFLYVFKIMDGQNQKLIDSMADEKTSLASLQQQDQSFKQAQSDLQELASKTYQPDNFFSKDINFVDELQTFDDLGSKYNVQMNLSGIAGTIQSLPAANTVTPIVMVPYALTVTGSLSNVVDYIQNMENLSFITNITAISFSASTGGQVTASMSATFYLMK